MRITDRVLLLIVSLAPLPVLADDPRDRDEDISAATLAVEVHQENGAWHYTYTVEAPATNKGTIQFLNIDLACDQPVSEWEVFDPSMHVANAFDDYSDHAATTPTAIAAAWGQAYDFGLTRRNDAMFALDLAPGNVANGLLLVSPYGPKLRTYWLRPDFMVNEQWDYPEDAEEQPDIPTADDFTVTGVIHGPACPGEKTDEPEPDLFDGSV